jgi:hypothetical protein
MSIYLEHYRGLEKYCTTSRQMEILNVYITNDNSAKFTAKELNCDERYIRKVIETIKTRAASAGHTEYFDATRFVDSGQTIKGKSTLTKDDEGNTVWIKTSSKQATEDIAESVTDSLKALKPWKIVKKPAKTKSDLCTLYTLTDYHIGAYSWSKETGDNWDLKIAEKVLSNGVADLISGSPDSDQAIFCQLGDFLHWDGLVSVTPTAKNVLDSDGRYEKLTEVATNACVNAINLLLGKHKNVHVIMAEGNHDLAGSVWLRLLMKRLFSNNNFLINTFKSLSVIGI